MKLIRVSGRAGIEGNKKADKLEKSAKPELELSAIKRSQKDQDDFLEKNERP